MSDNSSLTHEGTVKWFNAEGGFGFIACDNGNDYLVQYSEIPAECIDEKERPYLLADERVRFDVSNGTADRDKARNVQILR